MNKNYVVKGAEASCEFGCQPCKLEPLSHRHITETGKNLANETDYVSECLSGFGQCRSGYRLINLPLGTANIQQLGGDFGGGKECIPEIPIPWQGAKSDVKIGNYKALLEDGWTICTKGYGIISLATSGQDGEVILQQLMENLLMLQTEVAQYMRIKQISDKYGDKLTESILLWNGYGNESLSWDFKSDEMTRDFCKYLSKHNPSLYNYFERRIDITAADGEKVDIGYLMGIYKALEKEGNTNDGIDPRRWMLSEEMISDEAMFNAFLEAGIQPPGQSMSDMLENFVQNQIDAKEEGSRYDGININDWKEEEKADNILQLDWYDKLIDKKNNELNAFTEKLNKRKGESK